MRLLITGATGLIGRDLSSIIIALGHEVYVAQHKTIPEFGTRIKLDIMDEESIQRCFERVKPEVTIHLAALTDVDQCEKDRELALQMNSRSAESIAKASRKNGSHLIHVSTDYVFDGGKGMYNEKDIPNPISWYGESKLRGERAVEQYASSWCIARTSTPYGLHPAKKSFPLLVFEKLSSGIEMQVLEDQYTSPTYVTNLCQMLMEVAERRLQGIIHLSGSSRLSRFDMAKLVVNKLHLNEKLIKPIKMENIKWLAKRPRDSSLDVSKATSILSNKPESIHQSLEKFAEQLRTLLDSFSSPTK